jgi:DNA-binding transcriptional MerR regulator
MEGRKERLVRDGFVNRTTAGLAEVNQRILIDWSERGLVVPDHRQAQGSGSKRVYSQENVVEVAVTKALLGMGIHRDIVRRLLAFGRSRPEERQRFFTLTPLSGADEYLVVNPAAATWQCVEVRRSATGQPSQNDLSLLALAVAGAGTAVVVVPLSAIKRQLEQNLLKTI